MQKRRQHGSKKILGSVQTSESVMRILEGSIADAKEEKVNLENELETIRTHAEKLRAIIYKSYFGNKGEKVPLEFSDSRVFISIWDKLDRALGNTILMVMPPSLFQPQNPSSEKSQQQSQQPIFIMPQEKPKTEITRQPVKGFFSGFHDVRIAKMEYQAKTTQDQTPTITTEKVTYDPKEIVYQLIPSLNQIKTTYFEYLHRHLSYPSNKPSLFLLKDGHERLQEEMSKYFNVVNSFCQASIIHQKEKIRAVVLQQIISISRIAQAEAIARAYQQPFIPNEVRAMMRAMQEGRTFDSKGFQIPSSDDIAKRRKQIE
jgi:hypothetical protein